MAASHDVDGGHEGGHPGVEGGHGGEGDPSPTWRPVPRTRAHEMVVEQVEEQVLAGALRVGDRLPAERDLASWLGVSRAAVREAIRVLEAQGVVASVGAGRDAGTVVSAMPSEALTRLLRVHVALTNFPMPDVVEARVLLERGSARLAASELDEQTLAGLRELLEAMDDPAIDRAHFNELDTAYHVAIAEAGGNRLVADMTTAIRGSMRTPILMSFEETDDWDGLVAGLRRGHHDIYDRLAAGDAPGAERAVEEHIRYAYERLLYRRG